MTITAVCVDDSSAEVDLIRRIMGEIGVVVVGTSNTGDGGLEEIRKHRPTLALLDVMLPGITGIEILDAIRAEQIPTIVVMCTSMKMLKERALRSGAREFVTKPYDEDVTGRELAPLLEEIRRTALATGT